MSTKKEERVELGDEVICVVTGFKGVVTGHCENLQGVQRFDVCPPVKKTGEMGEPYTIDVTSLRVIKKNKVDASPVVKVNNLKLGDEVRDPVTGIVGVIVSWVTCLNGCSRVVVQQKATKEGKVLDSRYFDVGRLELVKAAKIKEGQKKTGGPSERSLKY